MARKHNIRQITPRQMILRCYAEQKGQVWQAFCLDINLAAQGSTLQEVKRKLHEQIEEYLFDALSGADRKYADQLLSRKAPASLWVRYYLFKSLHHARLAHHGIWDFFNEVMPLAVCRA